MTGTTQQLINFESKGINIVGDLYLPADFDPNGSYHGVVMTPPFPQVRNQTLANYGPRLAAAGYVAIAFDYVSKGDSDSYADGFRNDDDFPLKWEVLRNGISFLASQPFVDRDNIFGLGICGGGNIMSSTIITDLRVKAFASVSAMLATDMINFADADTARATITAANEARQEMFETGKPVDADYFGYDDPDFLAENPDAPRGVVEGYDYYGTNRGARETNPNYSNVLLSNINETSMLNLGEHYADKMLQPYCGIVGTEAETRICTDLFFEKVTSDKELHEIEGASHVDLYDTHHVDQVVDIIVGFYAKHSTN